MSGEGYWGVQHFSLNFLEFSGILKLIEKFFALSTRGGIYQNELNSKISNFYLTWIKSYLAKCVETSKGQFHPNLAAFNFENVGKGAHTHLVLGQIIAF